MSTTTSIDTGFMASISIIYSANDIAFAESLALALEAQGHEVRPYSADEADDTAIVIWSRSSVIEPLICAAASSVQAVGRLIPLRIGPITPPADFDNVASVDMIGWHGEADDPRWRFILDEINIFSQQGQLQNNDVWQPVTAAARKNGPEIKAGVQTEPASVIVPEDDARDEVNGGEIAFAKALKGPRFPAGIVAAVGISAMAVITLSAILVGPRFLSDTQNAQRAGGNNDKIIVAQTANSLRGGGEVSGNSDTARLRDISTASAAPGSVPAGAQLSPADVPVIMASQPALEEFPHREVPAASGIEQNLTSAERTAQTPSALPDTTEIQATTPENDRLALADIESISEQGSNLTGSDPINEIVPIPSENEISSIEALLESVDEIEETAPVAARPEGLSDVDSDALVGLLASIERGKTALGIDTEPVLIAAASDGQARPSAATRQALAQLNRDCDYCPGMVLVNAGQFTMGADSNTRPYEGPARAVSIETDFAISASEVTFDEWAACVADGACARAYDSGFGGGARPVINVSYDDAVGFTTWLSRKTGSRYRLPSEAEWEYVASARASAVTTGSANFDPNSDKKIKPTHGTKPVASFAPNGAGAYDLLGNVWEWTSDCWDDSAASAPSSSGGANSQGCSSRVVKGGAWNSGRWRLRAAHRLGKDYTARENDVGFRVVKEM